jgi:uncharacterized Zn finger protein (UPF0148 family)
MRDNECKYCGTTEKPFLQHTELMCSVCGNVLKQITSKKALKAEKQKRK